MVRGLAAAVLPTGVLLCDDAEWAEGPRREEVPGENDLFDEEKLPLDEEELLLDEELCEDEWDRNEPELWLEWDELLL